MCQRSKVIFSYRDFLSNICIQEYASISHQAQIIAENQQFNTIQYMEQMQHVSVLLKEVLEGLSPRTGETVLDVTVGLGGHSAAFLEAVGETGSLIAMDADSENLEEAKKRLSSLPGTKTFEHHNFRELPEIGLPLCDVMFADLGLSSPHLDDPERGFSFRLEGPLDLRFDRQFGETAAEFVACNTPEELKRILFIYGEVRQSGKLGLEISARKPRTTKDLCACVEDVCGFRAKSVLPQVFQALRIAVNKELEALEILLSYGPTLLKEGGRMGIISFHSLEDRMVKRAFRELATPVKDETTGAVAIPAPYKLWSRKAVKPGEDEIAVNPRSRSARLRIIERMT